METKTLDPNARSLFARGAWACYRFAASLHVAIVLLTLFALLLVWSTVVIDRQYGFKVAQYAVYGTWWFGLLGVLLGVNILCATVIRLPWRRHQTGFVITHLGLLILLVGSLVSRRYGVDAQLPVFEGRTAHRAFEDTQRLDLTLMHWTPNGNAERRVAIPITFVPGPFNWSEVDRWFVFPWHLTRRDRGVIYDADGVRLEVVDYLASSLAEPAKPLRLSVRTTAAEKAAEEKAANEKTDAASAASQSSGKDEKNTKPAEEKKTQTPVRDETPSWTAVELAAPSNDSPHAAAAKGRHELPSGVQFVYWAAKSRAEVEAFQQSRPEGPLGEKGQIVLWTAGRRFNYAVDQLQPNVRTPLGDTGLEFEFANLSEEFLAVELRVFTKGSQSPDDKPVRMVLVADYPEVTQHDRLHGVYGSYWLDGRSALAQKQIIRPDRRKAREAERARIDLLQGPDGGLFHRAWRSPTVEPIARVEAGAPVETCFTGSERSVVWRVDRNSEQDRPGERLLVVPFETQRTMERRRRSESPQRAKLRLTVDDRTEEFWLDGTAMWALDETPGPNELHVVPGRGRTAALALTRNSFELGFDVRLRRFERRLDPGSGRPASYASTVDLVARSKHADGRPDDAKAAAGDAAAFENVRIELNRPVDFRDPVGGRSYRLFQESFNGPWSPGSPLYDRYAGPKSDREQLYCSIFSVNYDPGRGLKYLGSLLMIAGVATMFYMKAYFFRRRAAT